MQKEVVERGEKRLSENHAQEPAKKPRPDTEHVNDHVVSRDSENVLKNEEIRTRLDNQCFSWWIFAELFVVRYDLCARVSCLEAK